MARIRTIKPEFFTSEDVVSLSALARLLFIALWCEADKEGRFSWKPRTFKMRYFPADACDVLDLGRELLEKGMVKLYGDGLAHIPTFAKHQHVNPRESASILPAPDGVADSGPRKVGKNTKEAVFERDGHACVRCKSSDYLTIDHILPQCCGGPHIIENLRTLCKSCNSARPVAGDALTEDLAKDGLTIQSLRVKFGIDASILDLHAQVGREGKGKERKGKEGDSGTAQNAAPPPPPDFDGKNSETLNGKAVVSIASAWELPEEWGLDAEALGFKPAEVMREAERFRQYWVAGKGHGTRRSVKGWRQSWSNWLGKAAERQQR